MIRERYGASPLHLLAHLGALALAGWAVLHLLGLGNARYVVFWLVGAVIVHDFVLWPLYTLLDRGGRHALSPRALNHVRFPLVASGLLALVFFPLMCGKSDLGGVSGVASEGYLARWLLVSGALFAVSALLYVLYGLRGRSGGGSSS